MEKGVMTEEEIKNFIVKELPRLIATHPEIRYEILGVVSESFVRRDELKEVLDEIRQLREDFNRRFEEHSHRLEEHSHTLKEHSRIIAEHSQRIEELSRRIVEHSERIERLSQTIVELREDFNRRFDGHDIAISELKKSVDTIGSRWGIFVEDTFRISMKVLLKRHFGALAEEITIGGNQVDILITDSRHILVEITSSTKEKDVENLLKAASAYTEEKGVEPLLYIVTAYIPPRLYDLAKEKGITILSHDTL